MSSLAQLQVVSAGLMLAYNTLTSINDQKGRGSIEELTVDVNRTNLETGVVRGHVTRSYNGQKDQRAFGLTVKPNGKVECRFLDRKRTIAA